MMYSPEILETDQTNICQTLIDRLEDARRIIEEKFLNSGEILTSSISGIETLIASLDKLAKALDADVVNAVLNDLKAAADKLNALPEAQSSRTSTLTSLEASRDKLSLHIADMRTSLSYMRAFTVNIKIVAGGLGDLGSDFSLFADDIAHCIERGTGGMKELSNGITELRKRLDVAMEQNEVMSSELHKLLPELPRQLGQDADATQNHYRRVAEIVGEVSDIARDIRKRSARILAAQQIGDMTRQRIEHVQEGLKQLNDALPEDKDLQPLYYRYVYALMARQLSATVNSFHHDVSEIEGSMSGIAGDAKKILDLHSMVYGASEKGGILEKLHTRISQARDLVEQIAVVDQATGKTGQETAAAADKLNQQINEIQILKTDVQYMALNTTLKCAQIGDLGQPLSVVAVELREHGRKLETAAETSLDELGNLTGIAAHLAQDAVREESADTGTMARESQIAAKALEHTAKQLSDILNEANQNISEIIRQGDLVLEELDDSSERLRFRADIGEVLDKACADIDALGDAQEVCPPHLSDFLLRYLEPMQKSYTMAQERDIQKQFIVDIALEPKEEDAEDGADMDDGKASIDTVIAAATTAKPAAPADDDFDDVLF